MEETDHQENAAKDDQIEEPDWSTSYIENPELAEILNEIDEEDSMITENPQESEEIKFPTEMNHWRKAYMKLTATARMKKACEDDGKRRRSSSLRMITLFNEETDDIFQLVKRIGESPDEGVTVHKGLFLAKHHVTPKTMVVHQEVFVAVKFIMNVHQEPEKYAKLEAKVEKNNLVPDHQNIIGIKKPFISGKINYCVVFPFMNSGPLRSIVSSGFVYGIPEDCAIVALKETLKGLAVIHENGQVHKEISAAQIFLNENPEIRVSFSATVYRHNVDKYEPSTSSTLPMATICNWAAAPEVYNSGNSEYTPKADIWLIGITALELAYGAVRVKNRENLVSIIQKINKKKKLPKIKQPVSDQKMKKSFSFMKRFLIPSCTNVLPGPFKTREFSKGFATMVANCLDLEPRNRPTADELLQSKIFVESESVLYFQKEMRKRFNRY